MGQDNKFDISVIICTYNRCESLNDLLGCFLSQQTDGQFDYEIIVIDNNSKDDTKRLIESFIPKFNGKLRYLYEPKQGKPYALNLGIKEARGQVIAFTDDDCLLEKNYINNIYKDFKNYASGIGLMGGKISPHWVDGSQPKLLDKFYPKLRMEEIEWSGDDKPKWLNEFFLGPLGILNYGENFMRIDFKDPKLFYGANLIIKREVLERHGYFDTNKILGQDSEICARLLKAGVKGLYNPQLNIYHKIKIARGRPSHYYRWHYIRGKHEYKEEGQVKKLFYPLGIPMYLIRISLGLFIKSFFVQSVYQKILYRSQTSYNVGQMVEIAKRNLIIARPL